MAQTGEIQMFTKLRSLLTLTVILGIVCATSLVLAVQEDMPNQSSAEGASDSTQEPKEVANGHGASADCIPCHGDRPEHTSPDTAKLVTPVPPVVFDLSPGIRLTRRMGARPGGNRRLPVLPRSTRKRVCGSADKADPRTLLRMPHPRDAQADCRTFGRILQLLQYLPRESRRHQPQASEDERSRF